MIQVAFSSNCISRHVTALSLSDGLSTAIYVCNCLPLSWRKKGPFRLGKEAQLHVYTINTPMGNRNFLSNDKINS